MEDLTVGTAVWYTPLQEATFIDTLPIDTADRVGIVSRIHDKERGSIDLIFFGTNDEEKQNLTLFPMFCIGYSADKVGHSWHWIEHA